MQTTSAIESHMGLPEVKEGRTDDTRTENLELAETYGNTTLAHQQAGMLGELQHLGKSSTKTFLSESRSSLKSKQTVSNRSTALPPGCFTYSTHSSVSLESGDSEDLSSEDEICFDYGELQSQPHRLLTTFESAIDVWLSPTRVEVKSREQHPTCFITAAQAAKEMDVVKVVTTDVLQDQAEDVSPLSNLAAPYNLLDGKNLSKNSWLASLLSEIQRRASWRSLSNQPFLCRKRIYCCHRTPTSFTEKRWAQWPCALAFRRLCVLSSRSLLKVETCLPWPRMSMNACFSSGLLQKPRHPWKREESSLLEILQKGKFYGNFFLLGTHKDRMETEKHELNAIVPYRGVEDILHQKNSAAMQNILQTAMIVAYCALRQQLALPPRKTRKSSGYNDQKKTSVLPACTRTKDLRHGEPHESPCPGLACKQKRIRKRKRRLNGEFQQREHKGAGPSSIWQEKDHHWKKAMVKEADLLRRFGLDDFCLKQNKANDLHDKFQVVAASTEVELLGQQFELSAPPLRCGSPSSLDQTLRRKKNQNCLEHKTMTALSPQQKVSREDTLNKMGSKQGCGEIEGHFSVHGDNAIDSSKMKRNPCTFRTATLMGFNDGNSEFPCPPVTKMASSPSKFSCKKTIEISTKGHADDVRRGSAVLIDKKLPRIYDDVELSDRARSMLQALEDGRDIIETSKKNHEAQNEKNIKKDTCKVSLDVHLAMQRQEGLSKIDRKRKRKEAKKKRKKEKKEARKKNKRKKAKKYSHSSQFPMDVIDVDFTHEPSALHSLPNQYFKRVQSTVIPSESEVSESESCKHQIGSNEAILKDQCNIKQHSELVLLCSEAFIENQSELVATLASDRWSKMPHYRDHAMAPKRKILFVDTILVDRCGVDIEVPGRGACIVSSISRLRDDGVSSLIKRIVHSLSIPKYSVLHIFLCVDADLDKFVHDITRLQNTVMQQNYQMKSAVSFRLVSKSSLSNCVADTVLFHVGQDYVSKEPTVIENWLGDDKTRERILFLLSVVPCLSASGAIEILSIFERQDQGIPDSWLFQLLGSCLDPLKIFNNNEVHPFALQQLSYSLKISLTTNLQTQHEPGPITP